jgi:hypothetical protein
MTSTILPHKRTTSYLSSITTLDDYHRMVQAEDVAGIVAFLRQRFTERYIKPMQVPPKTKNGFTMMAVSCLMIESFESFYRGWKDTNRKSQKAFVDYFSRNQHFGHLCNHPDSFYIHVRCGILHQGETTGGWHIRRRGPLFDDTTKTINATKFLRSVEKTLSDYCGELLHSDWDSKLWKNLRRKMAAVCANCS